VVANWSVRPLIGAAWMFQHRPQHEQLVEALRTIPDDVSVCIPEIIGAHVAGRRHVERCVDQSAEMRAFGGQALSEAEYQVFDLNFNRFVQRMNARGAEVLYSKNGVVVLRLKSS
jgi:hypothetical protein